MPVRSKAQAKKERSRVKTKPTANMTAQKHGTEAKKKRRAYRTAVNRKQRRDEQRTAKAVSLMTPEQRSEFKNMQVGYQEALRERLAAQGHERKITAILNELYHMQRAVRDMNQVYDEETQTIYTDEATMRKMLVRERLLRTKLDAHMRLLNKYLPDLKSVDISASAHDPDKPEQSTAAAMMAAWSESLFGGPDDESEIH